MHIVTVDRNMYWSAAKFIFQKFWKYVVPIGTGYEIGSQTTKETQINNTITQIIKESKEETNYITILIISIIAIILILFCAIFVYFHFFKKAIEKSANY